MKMITIAAVVVLAILAVAVGACTFGDTESDQSPVAESESAAGQQSPDDQGRSGTSTPVFDPPSQQLGYSKEVEEDGWVEWEDTGILVAKDQLIVVAEPGSDRDDVEDALDAVGASIVGEMPSLDIYQAEIRAETRTVVVEWDSGRREFEEEIPAYESLSDAIDALVGNSVIEDAFPNPQVSANSQPPQPNDPLFDLQKVWYLDEIKVPEAWEIHKGTREVAIAVVDTGVDEIDDLAPKIIKRYNTTTKGTDTEPKEGERNAYHGTQAAGVAAAIPGNGKGMAGVAWESSLIAIKRGSNMFSSVAGIDAAIEQGAKIVNVSWGMDTTRRWLTGLKRVIDKAVQNDVLIVAGTSNEPPLSVKGLPFILGAWPAMYSDSEENVIAVGGTDNGRFDVGWGAEITVSAPHTVYGYAEFAPDSSEIMGGTSYAAPQVSGLAALIWSMDYEENGEFTLKPSQVREIIEETANNPHNDPDIGAGVIDAHAALVRTAEILGVELPEAQAEPPAATPAPISLEDIPAFVSVSSGTNHSCGLRADGAVECWGENTHGQSTPPSGQFLSVSAGSVHNCGLRTDGTIICWGGNRYDKSTPPDGQFISVSSGGEHSCGVRTNGRVECWGENEYGESTPPDGQFLSVSTGSAHSCGVRTDGTVECWGDDEDGKSTPPDGQFISVSAGNDLSCGVRLEGTAYCWGDYLGAPDGQFISVSAGHDHSCGVRTDGTVECWGDDEYGESMPPDGQFLSVSAGWVHTCGLRIDGTIDCWGYKGWGESTPPGEPFLSISAGNSHTCGLRADGTVDCWGSDAFGDHHTPPGGQFLSVSAGRIHICGLRPDGTVDCWGHTDWGQSTTPEGRFLSVSAGDDYSCGIREDSTIECWGRDSRGRSLPPDGRFSSVSAGYNHSCGLREDGTAECWGDNEYGKSTPPGGQFTSVSAGGWHSCGLKEGGTVECWGDYGSGQSTPPGGKFISVSAGQAHNCGLRPDGTVICWGNNNYGQSTPLDGRFLSVSAGPWHACGVREDGTAECWGMNVVRIPSWTSGYTGVATPATDPSLTWERHSWPIPIEASRRGLSTGSWGIEAPSEWDIEVFTGPKEGSFWIKESDPDGSGVAIIYFEEGVEESLTEYADVIESQIVDRGGEDITITYYEDMPEFSYEYRSEDEVGFWFVHLSDDGTLIYKLYMFPDDQYEVGSKIAYYSFNSFWIE